MKRAINRAQFLRGDLRGAQQVIRPPWSRAETLFTDLCQRCDDCIKRCPERILVRGAGGFPKVDFTLGACSFCGECAEACRHSALERPSPQRSVAWKLEVSITQDCLSRKGIVCRSCSDCCENAAIRFYLKHGGRSEPRVSSQRCSGCGECFAVCPSHAISILPSQRDYAA